jgi:O-antigen/teichoic acid export membrane protein
MRGDEGIGPQRWLRDISLNTLQVLAGQVLGVFIFLLLSRYLDKDGYGQLSWGLAVLTMATTILSLRLEQIVVRDVAAGKDASSAFSFSYDGGGCCPIGVVAGLPGASFIVVAVF